MPKPSPKNDPQAGDSLRFKGYQITVLSREGDTVSYEATHIKQGKRREGQQTVAEWRGWASKGKVIATGGVLETCVVSSNAAGPCDTCRTQLGFHQKAHIGVGLKCGKCCDARKHQGAAA
jgi:hypothetical protein